MKGYGICPSCLIHKYLHGKTCKTCSYKIGNCVLCKRETKIYVDGLCYCCYQDRQVLLKIKIMEEYFLPSNDYNKELFYLYLSYIKRYRLKYSQLETTSNLIEVLQTENITTIKSWNDIFTLSDRHLIMQRPEKLQGCVFVKIGNMLCELGIIPPRENDRDHLIAHHLSFFSTPGVEAYAKSLLNINTAQRTVINALLILLKLEKFANQSFKLTSLLQLNQFHVAQFYDQQMELLHSLQNKRKLF